jgi:hypothetical protein
VVGSYADRATALSVACGMTQGDGGGGGAIRVGTAVAHAADARPSLFVVRGGRVANDAGGPSLRSDAGV